MSTVTIRFNAPSERDYVLELLRRLNLSFDWREEIAAPKPKNDDPIARLFGSFPTEGSSDEWVASIYAARVDQTREVAL